MSLYKEILPGAGAGPILETVRERLAAVIVALEGMELRSNAMTPRRRVFTFSRVFPTKKKTPFPLLNAPSGFSWTVLSLDAARETVSAADGFAPSANSRRAGKIF